MTKVYKPRLIALLPMVVMFLSFIGWVSYKVASSGPVSFTKMFLFLIFGLGWPIIIKIIWVVKKLPIELTDSAITGPELHSKKIGSRLSIPLHNVDKNALQKRDLVGKIYWFIELKDVESKRSLKLDTFYLGKHQINEILKGVGAVGSI